MASATHSRVLYEATQQLARPSASLVQGAPRAYNTPSLDSLDLLDQQEEARSSDEQLRESNQSLSLEHQNQESPPAEPPSLEDLYLENAQSFVQSWDSSRRVKTALLLSQLLRTARAAAKEVRGSFLCSFIYSFSSCLTLRDTCKFLASKDVSRLGPA